MDGLINLLKLPGDTSHDLVAALRRILHTKKVGHTGTLDPAAAGVLPMMVGQGTRVAEYLNDKVKEYRAEVTLGITTTTGDGEGKVLERKRVNGVDRERIKEVLAGLTGEIDQIPPMYSAIHYHGERLYRLAREGRTVERPKRKVTISRLELLEYWSGSFPRLLLAVTCSRGTYIRSLAEDIGKRLGCGGYLSFLVRTASGCFHLEDSFTIEEIREMEKRGDRSFLLPIDTALQDIPPLMVKDQAVEGVLNGMALAPSGINGGVGNHHYPGLVRIYNTRGNLLAIGSCDSLAGGRWLCKPRKVFRQLYDQDGERGSQDGSDQRPGEDTP